jgi:gliding motility-associated-like protein
VDVASGQEVQALCVGRAVRFEVSCNRQVDLNKLYYNALPGTNATPAGCDFTVAPLANNTFTPTAAGAYSVAELSNPLVNGVPGGTGIVYVRNFQVYASPMPTFTLVACLNNTVQLTITDASYDQYFAQVGGGAPLGPLAAGSVTTLLAPAGSRLTVVGSYRTNGLCANQSTQTVPSLPTPTTPVLSRLTTSGALPGSLLLEVGSLPAGYLYDVQRADASAPSGYRRVATLGAGSSTLTLPGASAGLYRLGRRDVCRTDSAFSAALPTLVLSGSSANNVNALSWQAGGPVASYTLLRNGASLATLPAGTTSYADAAVSCGTTYTYRLQAAGTSGGQALSNEVAVPTVSTLAPPAPLVVASFDLLNRVVLSAALSGGGALPTGSTVAFSRQGGGQDYTFPALVATARQRDSTALGTLLASPPCYVAQLLDVCGNRSPLGPATCPVLLRAEAADPAGATARLSWSALRGPGSPAQGATYRVLTLGPDGTVLATSPVLTALTYLDVSPPADRQVLRYRIEASGAGLPGGALSYSNLATVVRQPYLAVPNAFTPNGDGLNDVLELKGRYLAGFSFVIVDRNGQQVFQATDRGQTWDGTIRGHAPVNGAYVWRFTMQDEAGQPYTRTGSVTILK